LQRRLYRFADRNQSIRIRATSYTHDALVLGNFRHLLLSMGRSKSTLPGR
jgi:hypothetical protein